MKTRYFFMMIFFLAAFTTYGQHDMHHMQMSDTTMEMGHDSMNMPPMSHAFSLNLPMSRNGSGTGWLPDSTPMYGYMFHSKKWMYMFHGNIFFRYDHQDAFNAGSRGDEKFDSVNWLMFMGQRKVGKKGLFRFNSMFSLDNLFGGNGYPLLFQTGESWKGIPLVDRQHPHDLFSELSVAYTYAFNKKTDLSFYVGYPGEPALGSVAFMHRVSSLYNPDAPLSHHWNDGTHITFGVATVGLRLNKFKIEASSFTGREPDENRWNFDRPRFDSYSGRLSYAPNAYWTFQVSEGFIKSPELTHPEEDVYRTTASLSHAIPISGNSFINLNALWGLNHTHDNENAALFEMVYTYDRWAFYTRYEWVQKSVEELNLNTDVYGESALFNVNALTLGLGFDAIKTKALNMSVGAQASYFAADSRLDHLYGRHPVSAEVYLRIYPPRMRVK